jgi:hypothetical protein
MLVGRSTVLLSKVFKKLGHEPVLQQVEKIIPVTIGSAKKKGLYTFDAYIAQNTFIFRLSQTRSAKAHTIIDEWVSIKQITHCTSPLESQFYSGMPTANI